ncbi:hypothetical protein [Streptomyces sp. NPDC017988]|uniref:hypothetical protein n=1 Tax=Streptomyces sp. NPDC017988 TaxID=3365025 RepID=UPI00379CBCC0
MSLHRHMSGSGLSQRAVERGELDPAKLTPRIASLPFDLLRGETMMTLRPVAPEEIEDAIFLPLVRQKSVPGAEGQWSVSRRGGDAVGRGPIRF